MRIPAAPEQSRQLLLLQKHNHNAVVTAVISSPHLQDSRVDQPGLLVPRDDLHLQPHLLLQAGPARTKQQRVRIRSRWPLDSGRALLLPQPRAAPGADEAGPLGSLPPGWRRSQPP